MPKPGDLVVVEGTKVGGGRREGTLVGLTGSLMRVRWSDGVETYISPGAGAVRFLPGGGKARSTSTTTAKPKARAATAKKTSKAPVKGKKKKK